MITKEWVQPIDKVHKLFRVSSDIKNKDGKILVTAYAVERPDGLFSVMFVNKDRDNDYSVKVKFSDLVAHRDRYFSGALDRVVFGPAEYQWHADPAPPAAEPAAGRGGGRGGQGGTGHADPDGPPSKSTVTAAGADTLYQLPKASIIVLRGKLAQ